MRQELVIKMMTLKMFISFLRRALQE